MGRSSNLRLKKRKTGKNRENPALRSRIMRSIRSMGTKPEKTVKALLNSLRVHYRVHARELAGCPDFVIPSKKTAIFVHGCFWHGHTCSRGARQPKTNAQYWIGKIRRNIARDKKVKHELRVFGWRPLVVWECQLRNINRVRTRVLKALALS